MNTDLGAETVVLPSAGGNRPQSVFMCSQCLWKVEDDLNLKQVMTDAEWDSGIYNAAGLYSSVFGQASPGQPGPKTGARGSVSSDDFTRSGLSDVPVGFGFVPDFDPRPSVAPAQVVDPNSSRLVVDVFPWFPGARIDLHSSNNGIPALLVGPAKGTCVVVLGVKYIRETFCFTAPDGGTVGADDSTNTDGYNGYRRTMRQTFPPFITAMDFTTADINEAAVPAYWARSFSTLASYHVLTKAKSDYILGYGAFSTAGNEKGSCTVERHNNHYERFYGPNEAEDIDKNTDNMWKLPVDGRKKPGVSAGHIILPVRQKAADVFQIFARSSFENARDSNWELYSHKKDPDEWRAPLGQFIIGGPGLYSTLSLTSDKWGFDNVELSIQNSESFKYDIWCGYYVPNTHGSGDQDRSTNWLGRKGRGPGGHDDSHYGAPGFGFCPAKQFGEAGVFACSRNGACTLSGLCYCDYGFVGADCSVQDTFTVNGTDAAVEHDLTNIPTLNNSNICMGNGFLTDRVLDITVSLVALANSKQHADPNGVWNVPLCLCYDGWTGSAAGEAINAYVTTFAGCLNTESGGCKDNTVVDEQFAYFMLTHQCAFYVGKERNPAFHTEKTLNYDRVLVTLDPDEQVDGMPISPLQAELLGSSRCRKDKNGDFAYGGSNCLACDPICSGEHSYGCKNSTSVGAKATDRVCDCHDNYNPCDGCRTPICPIDATTKTECGRNADDSTLSHGICRSENPICVPLLKKVCTTSTTPEKAWSISECSDILRQHPDAKCHCRFNTDTFQEECYGTYFYQDCKEVVDVPANGDHLGICVCNPGWSGADCGTAINPALIGPNGWMCSGSDHSTGFNAATKQCDCLDLFSGEACEISNCGHLNGEECNGIEFSTLAASPGFYNGLASSLEIYDNVCSRDLTHTCRCAYSMCNPLNVQFTDFLPKSGAAVTTMTGPLGTCVNYKHADDTTDWCGCYLAVHDGQLFNNRLNSRDAWSGTFCEYSFRSNCGGTDGEAVCGGSGTCTKKLPSTWTHEAQWLYTDIPQCKCSFDDKQWIKNQTNCKTNACTGHVHSDCTEANPCTNADYNDCGVGGACEPTCGKHRQSCGGLENEHVVGGSCYPIPSGHSPIPSGGTWYGPEDADCLQSTVESKTCDRQRWTQNLTECTSPEGFVCGSTKNNWNWCFLNTTGTTVNETVYNCECPSGFSGTYCTSVVLCPGLVHIHSSIDCTCMKMWQGAGCDASKCTATGGTPHPASLDACNCNSSTGVIGAQWPSALVKAVNIPHWHTLAGDDGVWPSMIGPQQGCRKLCPVDSGTGHECGSVYYASGGTNFMRCSAIVPLDDTATTLTCNCVGLGPLVVDNTVTPNMVPWIPDPDGSGSCVPACLNGAQPVNVGSGGPGEVNSTGYACVCEDSDGVALSFTGERCSIPSCVHESFATAGVCHCGSRQNLNATDGCASDMCDKTGAIGHTPHDTDNGHRCVCGAAYKVTTDPDEPCTPNCIAGVPFANATTCNCAGTVYSGVNCNQLLCSALNGASSNVAQTACVCDSRSYQWGGTFCDEDQCVHGTARAFPQIGCTCTEPNVMGGTLCDTDKCAINGIGVWNNDTVAPKCVCSPGWEHTGSATTHCKVNLCCDESEAGTCGALPTTCTHGSGGDCPTINFDYNCGCPGSAEPDPVTNRCPAESDCNLHGYLTNAGLCVCHDGWNGTECAMHLCGDTTKYRWVENLNATLGYECECIDPYVDDGTGNCDNHRCDVAHSKGLDPVTRTCVPEAGYTCPRSGACVWLCSELGANAELSDIFGGTCVCHPGFCGVHCELGDPGGTGECRESDSWLADNTWIWGVLAGFVAVGLVAAKYEGIFKKSPKPKGYRQVPTNPPGSSSSRATSRSSARHRFSLNPSSAGAV